MLKKLMRMFSGGSSKRSGGRRGGGRRAGGQRGSGSMGAKIGRKVEQMVRSKR